MPHPEEDFTTIGEQLSPDPISQMFGKKCFKIRGKAFVCFFQDCMVFKLTGDDHKYAMELSGAKLFDPSGKGRPMKEWVQVPHEALSKWQTLAQSAKNYVESNL